MRPSAAFQRRAGQILNSSPTWPSNSVKHVGQREKSRRAAGLVDDQRLMRAALAKSLQDPIGGDALVHGWDRANQFGERAPGRPSTNQRTRSFVRRMPTMLSMASAIDRQPRVRALRDDARPLR